MPDDKLFDCVVMGAGIAGVTAARDLRRAGFDVLLIEGADRIGGRMHSVRDFMTLKGHPVPVEAGAEYIHVEHHIDSDRYGEFWNELRHHGFTPAPLYKCGVGIARIPRNRLFFPKWRKTIPLAESVFKTNVLGIQLALNDFRKYRQKTKTDVSAAAFAEACIQKRKLKKEAAELLRYTLSAHTPGGLDEVSILGSSEDRIPEQLMEQGEFRIERDDGNPHRICGFDTLPNDIANEFLGAGGVLVRSGAGTGHCKIVKVRRLDDGTLEIGTKDGRTFRGRTAVCTFSAGMLDPVAGEGDAIFGPLLPAKKRKALQMVRMGPITKFALAFRQRLWDDDGGQWSKFMSVLSNPRGKARTFFSNYPKELNGPHVLTALMMNQDHDAIAGMSDEKAVARVFDAVGRIYGPRDKKAYKKQWTIEKVMAGRKDSQGRFHPKYLRQDWSKDPFAKGGNSYVKYFPKDARPMAPQNAREALKDPRDTLPLFWAGEATAPAYDPDYQPLAVHGAYISGLRCAEDVRHYLAEAGGDAAKFKAYYKDRYPLDRVRPKGPVVIGEGPAGGR